jgi:hypothetical protein
MQRKEKEYVQVEAGTGSVEMGIPSWNEILVLDYKNEYETRIEDLKKQKAYSPDCSDSPRSETGKDFCNCVNCNLKAVIEITSNPYWKDKATIEGFMHGSILFKAPDPIVLIRHVAGWSTSYLGKNQAENDARWVKVQMTAAKQMGSKNWNCSEEGVFSDKITHNVKNLLTLILENRTKVYLDNEDNKAMLSIGSKKKSLHF